MAKLNENCFVETEFDLLRENAVSGRRNFSDIAYGKKRDAADFSKTEDFAALLNDNGQYTGDTSVKGHKGGVLQ